MRKIIYCLPAFAMLAGCDQRAIEFAKKTGDLLTEYQNRINDQISAANSYYQKGSSLLGIQHQQATLGTLQVERLERRTTLEADYRENRKIVSQYRAELRDYAAFQVDLQKQWLNADLNASAPYLAQLMALESDQVTIEAFQKTLDSLTQPRSFVDEIGEIKKFVADTKTEFNKLICADLATKADAKQLEKDQNCPAS